MRGYDAWVTRNPWEEQAEKDWEEIVENGMRYWEDGQWCRENGRVRWRWACEYCGALTTDCAENCYTREWEDIRRFADENHPRDCECAAHDPLERTIPDDDIPDGDEQAVVIYWK